MKKVLKLELYKLKYLFVIAAVLTIAIFVFFDIDNSDRSDPVNNFSENNSDIPNYGEHSFQKLENSSGFETEHHKVVIKNDMETGARVEALVRVDGKRLTEIRRSDYSTMLENCRSAWAHSHKNHEPPCDILENFMEYKSE